MKPKHLTVLFSIAAILVLLLAIIELTSGMGGGEGQPEQTNQPVTEPTIPSQGTDGQETLAPITQETPDAAETDAALQSYLSGLSAATDAVYREDELTEGIVYCNTDERKFFTLPGVMMTDGDGNGKVTEEYYNKEYLNDGYTCVYSFPTSKGTLPDGVYTIADSLIDTLTVSTVSGRTELVINARKKIVCFAQWRMDYDESEISVFEAPDASKQLVVIDPGHGGEDSGAWKNGTGETIYNLAVSTELARLLRESGVQTIMLRNSDVFLEVYERAYIANVLDATLFVCIHHNSNEDRDRTGTITYYSASDSDGTTFTGKSLAELVNAHLKAELGTKNYGEIADTYIVTKNTNMPSILVEVAHMSNDGEFEKILTPEFQHTAANAIFSGVKEALAQVAQ